MKLMTLKVKVGEKAAWELAAKVSGETLSGWMRGLLDEASGYDPEKEPIEVKSTAEGYAVEPQLAKLDQAPAVSSPIIAKPAPDNRCDRCRRIFGASGGSISGCIACDWENRYEQS